MRKLVTIQKISEIKPIDGADNIEVAKVLGWQTVVKKGQFQPGDYCVWFEIDCFLPLEKKYEFLKKACYKKVEGLGEGLRLRTIKLRKTLSQGLAMPLDDMGIYKESDKTWKYSNEYGFQYYIHPELDEDLSRTFDVVKYEPPLPACFAGKVKGNFPSFIPKTDQERIQNLYESEKDNIFSEDLWFEVTVKMDGTSATFYNNGGVNGVCSRNLDLKLEDESSVYVKFAKESNICNLIPDGFAVQGELMGPGIQGNRENLNVVTLFVFDIYNIKEGRYLTPKERRDFVTSSFVEESGRITHVPLLEFKYGLVSDYGNDKLESLLQWADEEKSYNNDVAEGLVFKRHDGKFSFKVIANRFLLGEE